MKFVNGKDYYDSALSYGKDDNIVFVRENRIIMPSDVPVKLGRFSLTPPSKSYFFDLAHSYQVLRIKNIDYMIARVKVIFCGKIYHGIVSIVDGETSYIWQMDKLEEWLKTLGAGFKKNADDILVGSEPASNNLLDWLITNQVVVAICFPTTSSPMWEINSDQLKEVQFYRVIDAYAAFQEISMWVGGVLPQQNVVSMEVDNQTQIAKHGFDKNSFRKSKSKHT